MSAPLEVTGRPLALTRAAAAPRLALLGTGTVGAAFVERYQRLREGGLALPRLAWIANSRGVQPCAGAPAHSLRVAATSPRRERAREALARAGELRPGDVVVDATASERVAAEHPRWLARGVHVVTANKLGHGGPLERSLALSEASRAHRARYGDSATVGAGLPLLRSLRRLVRGGDRIHRVEGVLSGSLAWLFDHYDGSRPCSDVVREARAAGYTEPDPRVDLSGEDVRRKLLILARVAGLPLRAEQVEVQSLLPAALVAAPEAEVEARLELLDAPLAARLAEARALGAQLRFVGRFGPEGASVALRALPPHHPLCGGAGTDNQVLITSDRYATQPLVIRGPGAGAELTAAALLDDVVEVYERRAGGAAEHEGGATPRSRPRRSPRYGAISAGRTAWFPVTGAEVEPSALG